MAFKKIEMVARFQNEVSATFTTYGVIYLSTEASKSITGKFDIYDDEEAGLLTEFTGEAIILPNTNTPCEGDMFYVNGLTFKAAMIVNEVREQALLGRTHYIISFHSTYPQKINSVEEQVIREYTAVYDNIGTDENVVMDNCSVAKLQILTDLYKKLDSGYKNLFYDRKTSTLKVPVTELSNNEEVFLIDKYLLMFMNENRIIDMDNTLKWFKEVLGWYGQIEAKDENNTGLYGCINNIPIEFEALHIAPFTGIHMFKGEPLKMMVGFMLVQGIDQLYQFVKKNGWNQITEVKEQPWGGKTCSVTTTDGSILTFFE